MNNVLKVAFAVAKEGLVIKINGYTYHISPKTQHREYEAMREQLKEIASELVDQLEIRHVQAAIDMTANTRDTLAVQVKKTLNPMYDLIQQRQARDAAQRLDYHQRKKMGNVKAPLPVLVPYDNTRPLSQQPQALELVAEYREKFGMRPVTSTDYKKIADKPSRYERIFGSYTAFKMAALDSTLL